MQIHSAGPPPREGIEPHINVNDRSAAIAGARLHTRLQLQMLCCNCRCSAAIADARGCNCRYLAAIADARLQLQNYSVAIADSKYTLQALRPGETAAPPSIADTPKDRAAFQVSQNVLFTPLGCSKCLKLQVVVLHSRGCKRHVCRPVAAIAPATILAATLGAAERCDVLEGRLALPPPV